MPPTTGYNFGDIVLVPFPFTDHSATKKRPAVIVSSAAYHRGRRDLIIMAVTGQARPAAALGEVRVADWKAAGLIKPSAAPSARSSGNSRSTEIMTPARKRTGQRWFKRCPTTVVRSGHRSTEAMRRRAAARELLSVADRVVAAGVPAMSEEQIQTEIDAVRKASFTRSCSALWV